MRLSHDEAEIIRNLTIKYFGKNSNIYLFGSRADDKKRGGDIDIYIETDKPLCEIFDLKISFMVDLKNELGDQKIDAVIKSLRSDKNIPIYEIAKKTGVAL
ncbi:MAG: nucleotidyltransferase domain-containing protein [Candidatus Acididesulfobacter diazotrophicus]|jgi:predicted nucleotidyltransferase|uniref:Nucleotidyltransferase domain-containing protein n=1 Tax=Candidatus Acididesulfobacter diazotrophicus TaxID=2597226 RepID=A0A519BLU7_9DELT|nr:MAG: nucleotidyltransferase domain-containing protein [Candidatus Acididesulfobacter diazotrophicus]